MTDMAKFGVCIPQCTKEGARESDRKLLIEIETKLHREYHAILTPHMDRKEMATLSFRKRKRKLTGSFNQENRGETRT